MSREIEIEFKNLLSKTEFDQLCNHFNVKKTDFKVQHNHYFDTADFMLKNQGCALRIREKNNTHTLTLKQPHPDGLLEIHQPLDEQDTAAIMAGAHLPDGEVVDVLHKIKVSVADLNPLGTLSTDRAEVSFKNGLVVLDHSFYSGTEDYELEYESTEKNRGEETFHELLATLNIPERETENKIRRFFRKK
ncbi:MAG TPA: CYTH domain-containing protein [Bacillales bacterium]|nr:CYTH domain-containing protein [Bacillales bacterium]